MKINHRRSGVTLMEVLLATMILSIGVTALMALFPIGAVNFARAINQDRSTTHGVSSEGMFRYYWRSAWDQRDPITGVSTGACADPTDAYLNSEEPMLPLLEGHAYYGPLGMTWADTRAIDPTSRGNTSDPSYPVLVDLIGWHTNVGSPKQSFVAGDTTLPMRTTLRRPINLASPILPPYTAAGASTQAAPPYFVQPAYPHTPDIKVAIRLASLLDDLTFDNGGEAALVAGGTSLERAGRYTASWLIQRSNNNTPYTDVKVVVLVFGGRPQSDVSSEETAYPNAEATAGQKTLRIPLTGGQAPPGIRRGGWIGFSHQVRTQRVGGLRPTLDFYRIAAINAENPTEVLVEVERPIKTDGQGIGFGNYRGTAIVFEHLLEVFDRGVVSLGPGAMMK